ncbi:MAG TPA: MFS transporter [Geminicoccaceae bacterium]|nr:MFS transporter [Geminicoccaceae bacterium]
MTPPTHWRDMLAIMATTTVAGMTISLSFPLLNLVLEREGVGASLIGLNSAAGGLAIFALAPWLPRLIARLGALRCARLGLLIAVACFLLLPLRVDVWTWFGLRFLLGVGITLLAVVSEAAINALADDGSRGRVMGLYATLFCVGYAAGPLLVSLVGSEGLFPFALSAGLLAAALLPIGLARNLDAALAEPGTARLGLMWRLSPLAFGAILTFGFVETTQMALLPLYGLRLGYGEAGAALLLSLFIAGNILFQLPLGWLADRLPRRRVLLGCAAASLLAIALLPLAMRTPAAAWALLVAFGGVAGGLYTVTLALLGQRFRAGADLAVANTAFFMMYQLGAVAGPALGGLAMGGLGPHGLPLVAALALAAFLGLGLLPGARRRLPA